MAVSAQKYGFVVSGDLQAIFSYISDACSPAVNAHMSAENAYMPRSFTFYLRSMLIGVI